MTDDITVRLGEPATLPDPMHATPGDRFKIQYTMTVCGLASAPLYVEFECVDVGRDVPQHAWKCIEMG